MKVKLLGTGAANGIPGLFSQDRVSQFALKHGGKEIRTRSSAELDGVLKIDFPPDIFEQVHRFHCNPADWMAVVFTHSHEDHFALDQFQYQLYPFTEHLFSPFTIYGNSAICKKLDSAYPAWPFETKLTQSFVPFEVGDYLITPIAAFHDASEDCQNLIFEKDGKRFLYATDTGVWEAPTWQVLAGKQLDAIVIECTEGFKKTSYCGHLDIRLVGETLRRLRDSGALKPGARVVTTHHSSGGEGTHEELSEALAKFGAEPGYDGMEFEV